MEELKNGNKKLTLAALVISTVVFGLLLIPGLWISAFSFMLFDAPGTSESPFVISLFISIISFPVLALFSFSSWIFFFYKKYKAAVLISLLPFVSLIMAGTLFAVSEIFFGGNLTP